MRQLKALRFGTSLEEPIQVRVQYEVTAIILILISVAWI